MVRPERFELPTYSSGGCRSIQLSYGRTGVMQVYIVGWARLNDGTGETECFRRDAASAAFALGRMGRPALHERGDQPSTVASDPLLRLFDCRIFFRRRRDFGVTSTYSSSAINSIACSRLRFL
jgi:hypothetical protein